MEWDSLQETVISAAAQDRMLVDAGPGTGKTAVACARLAHLIADQDVRPSRTLMISFTRTAIAEIRNRLHGYIGAESFGVKVATVDAHAWTLHSGFDSAASLTGSHDQNIERVIELLRDDEDVAEYLQNVEHLIVDEAQDLVGVRADLVEAIIARLGPDCGVTVFFDEAQAIYGFSEDAEPSIGVGEGLIDRLRANGSFGFRAAALETVHRTSSAGLLSIFSEVRKAVLSGRGAGNGLFSRILQSVTGLADGEGLERAKLNIAGLHAGSLVLFRTRSEALETSQFCDAPHSLRLSGYGSNLPAWLGICFHDWVEPFMDATEFRLRWTSRLTKSAPDYGPEEAWARLVRFGGAADGSLDMRQLRRRLSRRGGPAELALPEYGLPGPVIGTIHASKGREAEDVLLLVAPREEFKSDAAEEEEARVLFVGSTRARASLQVGAGAKYPGRSLDSGRCYRRLTRRGSSERAMFEVGRENDLQADGLVGTGHSDQGTAEVSQTFLAEWSGAVSRYALVRGDAALDWNYCLVGAENQARIGVMSSRIKDDFWALSKIIGQSKGAVSAPSKVLHIKGLGCRTLVVDPDDAMLERLHAPWSESGFLLAPRLASFATTYFWKKN